jgi:hypothetical protein
MTDSLSIDHVILVVADLPAAIQEFEGLGFTVAPGGVHAGGLTHNALIGLPDGAYLELVAGTRRSLANQLKLIRLTRTWQLYPPARTPMGGRFLGLIAQGPGLGDFALLSRDLEKSVTQIEGRGLHLEGPFPGSRMRTDGQQVSWRTAVPPTTDLPFLIDDITPHDHRLPPESARRHPNRAAGVARITVKVADLESSLTRYEQLLGPPIGSASFRAGEKAVITLIRAEDPQSGSRRYLASRQGRPLKVELSTAAGGSLTLSHGRSKGYTLY